MRRTKWVRNSTTCGLRTVPRNSCKQGFRHVIPAITHKVAQ
jgi:hypothetical protein